MSILEEALQNQFCYVPKSISLFTKSVIRMAVNTTQIGVLSVLFVTFLYVPTLARSLGHTLDTLPIRLAAVILILASIPYDPLVSLGLFLVITGLYIQLHHDDVLSVTNNKQFPVNAIQDPAAMKMLHHGGHAQESYETDDFMPNKGVDNNTFESGYGSIDEKHALPTEPLGSKSQSLFGEDMVNAEALQHGNRNGSA